MRTLPGKQTKVPDSRHGRSMATGALGQCHCTTVLIAVDAPPSFVGYIAHADAQLSFVVTTVHGSVILNICYFSAR